VVDFEEGNVMEDFGEYEDETKLAAVESADEVDAEMLTLRFAPIAKL
jgi:hypothetical protein